MNILQEMASLQRFKKSYSELDSSCNCSFQSECWLGDVTYRMGTGHCLHIMALEPVIPKAVNLTVLFSTS